jgi:hypothetical protein
MLRQPAGSVMFLQYSRLLFFYYKFSFILFSKNYIRKGSILALFFIWSFNFFFFLYLESVTRRQLRGLNNLEFRVRNSLLGYRGSIYTWWRPNLKCRRLGRWLGRRLGAWHVHA